MVELELIHIGMGKMALCRGGLSFHYERKVVEAKLFRKSPGVVGVVLFEMLGFMNNVA